MKYKVKVGEKYITITPTPVKDIPNGLKVYLNKPMDTYLKPQATTNIVKGKSRYFYKKFFKGYKIIKAVFSTPPLNHEPENKS